MKIKLGLLILVFGYVLGFIGEWLKITHQAGADLVLTLTAFLKVAGLLLFTFTLLAHPKVIAFLNYHKQEDAFK
ncbi:hypothetical protein [Paraflavitalea speifideaquila]|uniref:hypothetical protein n=1 Tax=Paraflavitalea speifideaquila TaxID=3076558 RepID=UPI0028E4EEB1|nr:hypothetical protein [Paraflavitalea speifideiaquila]